MIGKFYNKMPFSIRMRKTWETGAPAIELESGGFIEGPAEILSQFKVLAALPSDFCEVDSIIQTQGGDFMSDEKTDDLAVTAQPDPVVAPPVDVNGVQLPFDPKNVNWLHIKVADLEAACKILNVDISPIAAMKPKEKKWALVKLVKAACGISVK